MRIEALYDSTIQLNLALRFRVRHLALNGGYFHITEGMSKYPFDERSCL